MRLIDADALINQIEGMASNEWNISVGSSKGLEDALDVIENAPTVEPRQYIIKAKHQTDIEKLKAVSGLIATPQEIEIVPLTPEGNFTIDELRAWLYEIAFNNIPSEFEKHVVEIIQRLDGFERFCRDRRGGDAHE